MDEFFDCVTGFSNGKPMNTVNHIISGIFAIVVSRELCN